MFENKKRSYSQKTKSPLPQIKTVTTHPQKNNLYEKLNCAVFVTLELIENEHVGNKTPQSP